MRTILCVLYVFLFLVLGLPVLGVEWLIAKRHKQAADISQLHRPMGLPVRCFSRGNQAHGQRRRECAKGSGSPLHRQSQKFLRHCCHLRALSGSYRVHRQGWCPQGPDPRALDGASILPVLKP